MQVKRIIARALAYELSVSFFKVTLNRVPEKDCEARFFGKRNGNGAKLSPL